MSKIIFTLLAFVPLCWHSPYLLQAWRSSRLDQWDWIFYLAAIPAAIWAMRKEKLGKCDFYALFLLIPMLCLTFGESFHHINALLIISAVGVIFSAVWLLGSWTAAYRILPAVVILFLGTPSSSYQFSLLLMSGRRECEQRFELRSRLRELEQRLGELEREHRLSPYTNKIPPEP